LTPPMRGRITSWAPPKPKWEALREFQKALALDPGLPEPYFGLGTVYMLQGHKEKAIEAFERFLELDLGRDPRARAEAERALKELKGR